MEMLSLPRGMLGACLVAITLLQNQYGYTSLWKTFDRWKETLLSKPRVPLAQDGFYRLASNPVGRGGVNKEVAYQIVKRYPYGLNLLYMEGFLNKRVRLSLHTSQMVYQAGAYPRFCNMKRLEIFLPLGGMQFHRRIMSQHLICRYPVEHLDKERH